MSKITVEIDDDLEDIVESVIEDVKTELENWLKENPDSDECPELYNDLDYSGSIHEIIDGAVPIYTNHIEGLFYLHGDKFEDAFDDAGIGDKNAESWPSGWKAAAIYCYLEQRLNEWWRDNAEDIFDEWKDKEEDSEEDEKDTEKED